MLDINLFSRLSWYGLVVFLTSAIVMIIELSAGRLLAPYIGVSLYTWTSIIGVVLAGLSIGSYLGGLLADRGAREKSAGLVIALAGIFSLGSLSVLKLIVPIIQFSEISLLSASFLYMLVLFMLPATLLGIVLPLLTTLGLKLDSRPGHIVGRMHALGALGSIVGTFVTGYWLIQTFGTRVTLIGCGIALIALAAPFLFSRSKSVAVLLIALLGGWLLQNKIQNPCDKESNYFCLRAIDVSAQTPFGTATALVLDHLMHGVNHKSEPELLLSPYVHLMHELPKIHFTNKPNRYNYFFAGGGAYTQPRALAFSEPKSNIIVAEVDPQVTQFAKEHLYLDPLPMKILHKDARLALEQLKTNSLDVIVGDVFHDISVPYHLLTKEYVVTCYDKLKPDGLFMANLVDVYPEPLLVKAFAKTLGTEFKYVSVWLDHIPSAAGRKTYIIAASNLKPLPATLNSQSGLNVSWYNISRKILAKNGPDIPILTDDFVPVERLISTLLLSELGN